MEYKANDNIPQEGTSLGEAIQSLGATASSPVVSGGGNIRLGSPAPAKREKCTLKGKVYDRKKGTGKKKEEKETGEKKRDRESEQEMETESAVFSHASDSDESVKTIASARSSGAENRLWQELGPKRRRRNEVVLSESSDCEISVIDLFKTPSPVFDRPNSKSRRKEFLAENRENDLEAQARRARENREALGLVALEQAGDRTAKDLNKQVLDDVAIICDVAAKSGNLKGTFQRALKEAAASIKVAVEVLHKRTSSEETIKLQADNVRLHAEVADLRKEIAELRNEFTRTQEDSTSQLPRRSSPVGIEVQRQPPAQGTNIVDEITRSIMLQVGSMMSARLEGLEERLLPEKRLRPPLAVDRNNVTVASTPTPATPSSTPRVGSSMAKATGLKAQKKKKKKKDKGRTKMDPATSAPRSLPPPPESMDEGWSTVVRRGIKRVVPQAQAVAVPGVATHTRLRNEPAQVKLRAPRSAAIVIKLRPEAAEGGITYAKLLAEARSKVDLASCGIAGLRFRKAATGACILEVPGATSGGKADSLAEKLRIALDPGVAEVSRPMKCAEVRISGLDDSVTPADIAEAIAARGDCSAESVKVGEIKRDSRGTCSVWVRCPVVAAKKLGEGGRLLVGWIAAQVRLLKPRTLRCFRCLSVGHVRVQCTSDVDRSAECYRCGQAGHKAAQCMAAVPKCSLCAAANKKSDHRVGSKDCSPPKSKKGAKAPAAVSCPPTQAGAEEVMAIN